MHIRQQVAIWEFIQESLEQQSPVVLMCVVESNGSSPGRKGFCIAVSSTSCVGTIGGGIMEYKLVELCRTKIAKCDQQITLMTQYHDKVHASDQSGMICSGMQRVALVPLNEIHLESVNRYLTALTGKYQAQVQITPEVFKVSTEEAIQEGFVHTEATSWHYSEKIGVQPRLHIIGAGHVSLALSELMSMLGFYTLVYDNRPELNTFLANQFAHERHLVEYNRIEEWIPNGPADFVAIMTIGYRTDKVVLRQLAYRRFYYIGMLGSRQKLNTVFDELRKEGISEAFLRHVHAPIGLPIGSQTAHEIAVSIAAEMIRHKNLNRSA